jgi:hypothetical protein
MTQPTGSPERKFNKGRTDVSGALSGFCGLSALIHVGGPNCTGLNLQGTG